MASKIVQMRLWNTDKDKKDADSEPMDELEFQKQLKGSMRALFAENYSLKKGYSKIAAHCEIVEGIVFQLSNRVDRMSEEMVKHV